MHKVSYQLQTCKTTLSSGLTDLLPDTANHNVRLISKENEHSTIGRLAYHIGSKGICVFTLQLFALEITGKGTFSSLVILQSSPLQEYASVRVVARPWSTSLTLYAEKAPGRTAQYPNTLSVVLSKMFDILYSKFWAATE